MDTKLKEIAQKAFECQQVCNECFDACLEEEHVGMMVDCIRTDRECADVCALVSTYVTRESVITKELIQLCATICQACGEECHKHDHDHCQKCAKVCFECAELCRSYAA